MVGFVSIVIGRDGLKLPTRHYAGDAVAVFCGFSKSSLFLLLVSAAVGEGLGGGGLWHLSPLQALPGSSQLDSPDSLITL